MNLAGEYEVVVIGGGPAGSTAATLLAENGRRVLVLERDRFPRFHIGESLMPETYWTFQRLGVLERLERSEFPKKRSVQFISDSGRAAKPFYFRDFNPHRSAVTWQVERSEFDRILLDRAREAGAEVREEVLVREVLFEGTRAVGVRAAPVSSPETGCEPDRSGETIRAAVTVDASGQSALIARRLGLWKKDPRRDLAAVFAHYGGAVRDSGVDENATLVVHTAGNRGWFWYIPLSRDRVSVGVVAAAADLLKDRGPADKVLEEEIAASVEIRRRLAPARRLTRVRVLRDFCYRADRFAGDGWVLVGDAFGFLDPVFSSGVFLALKSAEVAADRVEEALESEDLSADRLGGYGHRFLRGMEALRKLVDTFYTPGFSFAQFVHDHPEHRQRLVDFLTGDVFKDGVEDLLPELARSCSLSGEPPVRSSGESGAGPVSPSLAESR